MVTGPSENSDIEANAFRGKGGNVNINAQGVIGFNPPNRSNSQITATSTQGVQGVVAINQPDVDDPTQGLVNLPSIPLDRSQQIAQSCRTRGTDNQFIVTGRGGLPLSPDAPLRVEAIATPNWITLNSSSENSIEPGSEHLAENVLEDSTESINEELNHQAIAEANDWIREADGSIKLVARSTSSSHQESSAPEFSPYHCRNRF